MIAPRLMLMFAASYPRVRFVEVGANDGVQFDPLRPYIRDRDWSGVLVEPIPHVFERLSRTYGDHPRVDLANVAIGSEDGWRPMYFVAPDGDVSDLPAWHDAIASFDRAHVLEHIQGHERPDSLVRSVDVECMRLETLCRKHDLVDLDLLLIDAEGADGDIVESIDFDVLSPRLIVYEHHHLDEDQRDRCARGLREHGYSLIVDGLDTWALDVRPGDRLAEQWLQVAAEPAR